MISSAASPNTRSARSRPVVSSTSSISAGFARTVSFSASVMRVTDATLRDEGKSRCRAPRESFVRREGLRLVEPRVIGCDLAFFAEGVHVDEALVEPYVAPRVFALGLHRRGNHGLDRIY